VETKILDAVLFEDICLQNYGIFQNPTKLVFDHQSTFVVGANGSGRTTIFNALACLGPAPGVKSNVHLETPVMSVTVSVNGNKALIQEYSHLIFIGEEARDHGTAEKLLDAVAERDRDTVEMMARSIFQGLLVRKCGNITAHRVWEWNWAMAQGERVCLNYSYFFAVREYLGLALPMVIEQPFGLLDPELSLGLCEYLMQIDCQKILFLGESEYERVRSERGAHFILDRPE
jgi:hypothetical protein